MNAALPPPADDLLDLFRMEAESHATALEAGLVALDPLAATKETLEPLMRAAHSLKGAARIVGLNDAVVLAHAMEDVFVAAQKGRLTLEAALVDRLLAGVDFFARLAMCDPAQIPARLAAMTPQMTALAEEFGKALAAPGGAPLRFS